MAVNDKLKTTARVHDSLARAYTIIGRLFLEIPTAELLSATEAELASSRDYVGSICEAAAQEMDTLRESACCALADIKADYARLFAGVKKLPAPPWESCYLSGKRQVCTEVTERVRLAYLAACLCQDPSDNQPDDHIGLELQFLGAMSKRIADALYAEDCSMADVISAQRNTFIAEHLSRWAFTFCQDLEQAAETEFYRALARLVTKMIRCEVDAGGMCGSENLQNG